jgi:hypothetical protein
MAKHSTAMVGDQIFKPNFQWIFFMGKVGNGINGANRILLITSTKRNVLPTQASCNDVELYHGKLA